MAQVAQETITSVANGVTVAAVASVPYVLFKIVEKLEEYSKKYGEAEIKEMNAIIKYYTEYCDTTLPPYFEMKENTPVMCGSFYPNPDFNDWLLKIEHESDIAREIREMISQICQYQIERNNRYKWSQGYCYDPTNLFLEEFKDSLARLSNKQLNDESLKLVEGRIKYLKKLLHNQVFIPGDHMPTRETVLQDLIDNLDNSILVLIQCAKHRDSSREHFKKLKNRSEKIVLDASTFLFNIFRDSPQHTLNFIIKEIRNPSMPSYEKVVSTISGNILQWLLCTEEYQHIFRSVNKKINLSKQLNINASNDFIDEEGNVIIPPIDKLINIDNWYLEDQHQLEIGILKSFRTKKIMDTFIKLHGQIQSLCTFCHICDKMYELSGSGGDLLLYAKAVDKVSTAIYDFNNLLNGIETTLSYLFEQAQLTFREVIGRKIPKNPELNAWRNNYKIAEQSHTDIMESIEFCSDVIDLIDKKIIRVNSKDYQKDLENQVDYISQLVTKFSTSVSTISDEKTKKTQRQKAASTEKKSQNDTSDSEEKGSKVPLSKRKSDYRDWYCFFGGVMATGVLAGVGYGAKKLIEATTKSMSPTG